MVPRCGWYQWMIFQDISFYFRQFPESIIISNKWKFMEISWNHGGTPYFIHFHHHFHRIGHVCHVFNQQYIPPHRSARLQGSQHWVGRSDDSISHQHGTAQHAQNQYLSCRESSLKMLKVMVDTFNNDLVYTIIYSYIVLYIYIIIILIIII